MILVSRRRCKHREINSRPLALTLAKKAIKMAQNTQNNILVVGGSSGVGLAVAKLALSHLPSVSVIVSSSSETKLKEAVQDIKASNKTDNSIIEFIVGDVSKFDTQYTDVEALLKAAAARFDGKIDHIVWTAGTRPEVNDNEPNNADVINGSTTRTLGPLTLSPLAKKYMTDSKHSSITVTSGVLAYRPLHGRGRMTGLADGLESTARGLAVDLAPIRANFVVLGLIQTPLLEGFDPTMIQHFADKTLLRCVGAAEEAAEAYLYCMRCAYVTGSRIDVEGGALLC